MTTSSPTPTLRSARFVKWDSVVAYDVAIDLLSTDQRLTRDGFWTVGTNSKACLDSLTAQQCLARAAGAWDANLKEQHVAYKSAAAYKLAH